MSTTSDSRSTSGAEESPRRSAERFRSIFEHSNDAIFVIDPSRDQILDVNPQGCRMLGYSREELLALPVSVIHPDEMPKLQRFAESVMEKSWGRTDELSCLTRAGERLPTEMSASVTEVDGQTCLILMVRDIHLRKEAEAALQEEKARLESEYARKSDELDEARRLQVSMLPIDVPETPSIDLAFEMRTASEVGGDYYDFNTSDGGVLTLAVGDATGHGFKAGIVVAATKMLFKTSPEGSSLLGNLTQISRGIQSMNLRRLNMALTLASCGPGRVLRVVGAGMPPLLYYRAASRAVSEIVTGSPPLGSMLGFRYRESKYEVAEGDTFLLSTDGLAERLDPEDEMMGYERVRSDFQEVAERKPQEIIDLLLAASETWSRGRHQEDDITLVVVKCH